MVQKVKDLFLYLFPGVFAFLLLFVPVEMMTLQIKIVLVLALSTIYFLIISANLQYKLKTSNRDNCELGKRIEILEGEQQQKNNRINSFEKFIHRRKVFKDHGLKEIKEILFEYNGVVENKYRGKAHQDLITQTRAIKNRSSEIINKEKREFDEQLFDIQSYKDN